MYKRQVDGRDRGEDEQDQEGDLLPFQCADRLGEIEADTAGANDADDGRGAGVRLDVVCLLYTSRCV